MRISTPLTSRARKDKVISQCVTRTRTECRGRSIVAGTAEAEVPPATESVICENVPMARPLCTGSETEDDTGGPSGISRAVPAVWPTISDQGRNPITILRPDRHDTSDHLRMQLIHRGCSLSGVTGRGRHQMPLGNLQASRTGFED